MTGKHRIAFIVFLALVIEARPVDAIVVRHDRDEKAFIDLAQRFPATVTFYLSARRGSFAGMGTLVEREAGQSPYKAIVELKEQVVAEIRQGERTVIEYLLSPVQKTLHDAAREQWVRSMRIRR